MPVNIMKKLAKNYFKSAIVIFAILYFLYLIFEFTIFDSQINVLESFVKVAILSLIFPLFSQKYLAQVSSVEGLKKFNKTRKNLLIFVGAMVFIGIVMSVVAVLYISKNITN